MDELPAHAKDVLRRAQGHDQCHDEDARRRVREGVARAVGVSAVGASIFDLSRVAAQPAARVAKSAPLASLLGKLTVTALVVALAGSGIALHRRNTEPPAHGGTRASAVVSTPRVNEAASRSSAQSPFVSESVEGVAVGQDERASGAGVASRRHAMRRSRSSGKPTPETLDAEVVLLRRLEDAVSRRDTGEAERLLAQHRARFAQPALREERQGFTVLVGCMKHATDGPLAARAFVARYPSSVLTARVLRECVTEGP